MFKYFLKRLIRALISTVVVVGIVFVLVYTLIPKEKILEKDNISMQGKKGDVLTTFRYQQFENYGYIDFVEYKDYCAEVYGLGTEEYTIHLTAEVGSENDARSDFADKYKEKGYTIEYLTQQSAGTPLAYKNKKSLKMLWTFFSNLISFDGPNKIQDVNNPNLERNIYVGEDWDGVPALMCSGCEHKYLIYFDNKFPFIHQNWININLGTSYPTYSGSAVTSVLFADNQGEVIKREVTWPSGDVSESGILEHTLTYKEKIDRIDKNRFGDDDHYVKFETSSTGFSKIGTSFIIGVLSFILSYVLGIPAGILMAQKKDKIIDKLLMVYIIFIISVPSLVYIFIFQRIGGFLNIPTSFPILGETKVLSYILPIVSLALPSVSSLMMWMRRYMIDQSLSDYVRFAKAKGLSKSEIFYKHIMRNAIVPIVHGIPGGILLSLTGAIITERVYSVPGMGKMLTNAINENNNATIVALTLIYTLLSVVSIILGDILMAMVDPRISYESGGRK